MKGLSVSEAIASRTSVRAFKSTPVPNEIIAEILSKAARAPSGSNIQPWKVYVTQGDTLNTICQQVCAAYDSIYEDPTLAAKYIPQYDYYPKIWETPYIERRRQNGWGLYGLLGITKGDKAKMHAQHRRNFECFDAPVCLFFTINKNLEQGSILDYGMFLENIMLLAKEYGLDTCAQGAWNNFWQIVTSNVKANDSEMFLCGMSIGYANPEANINRYRTPRVELEEFVRWL